MTATPPLPPPTNPALLPTLAAVVYIATIVALWGILSLVLDRTVIDYADAGPLLGPAMVTAAVIVTWITLWRTRNARSPWLGAVVATAGTFLIMLAVAAVGYAPVAAAHFALSPFVLGAALLAGLLVMGTWAVGRSAHG